MDFMGYGPHIRQARRDAYKVLDRLTTAGANGNNTWIITGSKAEGLTCFFESDRDSMDVATGVICLEDGVDSSSIHGEKSILRACSRMSYAGHCILLLERYGTTIHTALINALCDDGYCCELLSSTLYVNQQLNAKPLEDEVLHERAGPSIPSTLNGE
ncbi:hypothetical protein DPMN_082611 [Dreissena polymorpha]|uniref:Uncharacterized protein n=1 Tax=Dreissena polymorpha TaxID=45954 RepID=A0A9D4BGZ3_DREPO|nr:hypothetical protein DPMN_082611 [Dreissena polymorpha]